MVRKSAKNVKVEGEECYSAVSRCCDDRVSK